MDSMLEELQRTLQSAFEGMSADELQRHPANKWSAAQILEHLYLTYTGTAKGFERVLQAGRPMVTSASMRQRAGRLMVLGIGYFPSGREAPANTRPKGLPLEQVKNEVGAKISAMDRIITECEACFGRQVRLLDHSILGPLTAAQWRRFHLVHGRHHCKQILRLRDAISNTEASP
jgi:hypothetical protein